MSVASKEFGNAAIPFLRMAALDPSKFPMKSIRGTILGKRTGISKTDKCHPEPTNAAVCRIHDFA